MALFLHVCPGGNSAFGPCINSFIHTLMYSYYGITGAGISLPVAIKKLMTSSQLLQFVVILGHAIFHLVNWGTYWPPLLAALELLLMIQMLFMFGETHACLPLLPLLHPQTCNIQASRSAYTHTCTRANLTLTHPRKLLPHRIRRCEESKAAQERVGSGETQMWVG